jgi:nitroreductase
MTNKTKNNHTFNEVIEKRWSNRYFSSKTLKRWKLNGILKAASRAPYAFKEQICRFLFVKNEARLTIIF